MQKVPDTNTVTDTETRIMQAAEREFMVKGFAGARTTSIAEAAGVTHAMFHYYFRTKEKLFDRIVSEKIDMLKVLISQSLSDLNLPLELLIRNLIDLHLDFIAKNPDMPRFLITEIFSDPARLLSLSDKVKEVATGVLSRLQQKINSMAAAGECRQIEASMLILDIVSLNVFPYLASPLVNRVLGNCMDDSVEFLEQRKKENFDIIMRKLKP